MALLACSFLIFFSVTGVNAIEDNVTDGTIINDTNALENEEKNISQSSDVDSIDNDTENQEDTVIYQTSAEDPIGSVTVEEVETASIYLKNYVDTYNSLPESIPVGSYTLTLAEFLKVLLTTMIQLDQGDTDTPIIITVVGEASNPAGNVNSGNILKSEYLQNAINILNFINANGRAPNYCSTSLHNLRFEGILFSYAKIIDFYKEHDRLPNYTIITKSDFMGSVTIEEIETASAYIKNYVETNKVLPETIQVGSKSLTMSEFLKVLLDAVINLDQNRSTPVAVTDVGDAPSPAGQKISGNILKSEYLEKATSIRNFIDSYGRAPNFSKTSLGNLRFEYIVFSYAKIIDFYKEHDRLPNYTKILSSDFIWKSEGVYNIQIITYERVKYGDSYRYVEKVSDTPTTNRTVTVEISNIDTSTGGDVTNNSVLMQYISRTDVVNKLIEVSKNGTPMIRFGDGTGTKVMMISGVHGNEIPPQIAMLNMVNYLMDKDIQGTIYIVPFAIPSSTANVARYWNGQNPNTISHIPGTPTYKILNVAKQNKVNYLGDFHSTREGGYPGANAVFCSKYPLYTSYKMAYYISKQTSSKLLVYSTAAMEYPGAVEDASNIMGIPAITCESLSNHGTVRSGSVSRSFYQMVFLARYVKLV